MIDQQLLYILILFLITFHLLLYSFLLSIAIKIKLSKVCSMAITINTDPKSMRLKGYLQFI